MLHKIKLQKPYCDPVLLGMKNFEVRYNDRGYQKGDYVEFIPMDGIYEIDHPLRNEVYKITYVHSGYGLDKDVVVFGIVWSRTKEERSE